VVARPQGRRLARRDQHLKRGRIHFPGAACARRPFPAAALRDALAERKMDPSPFQLRVILR
jgi:hypothetical protein